METGTILIVDDEKDIRDIVGIYLENSGYRIIKEEDGQKALELLEHEKIDLAIIDVMMPKMDGVQLCMKIRDSRNLPIIMLSAKNQDMDKVLGLSAGADDYLAKPFNPVELLARVRAQLRRFNELNPNANSAGILKCNGLTLYLENHKATLDDKEVRLTPTEFSILKLLWENKGIVFSTDRIYNRIWSEEEYEVDNTVMVHIRNLREKIERDKKNPVYIKTVWGVGYKFGD
jgi:DNA-binding response OmpR family regulator